MHGEASTRVGDDDAFEVDSWPTERWGDSGASGVRRTLPPPPGAARDADRYEQGALLGRGGMGDVHACEDRRIGRTVARKTLRAARGEVDATSRFIDEARLQGRLEHPAIVPVYDLGTDEDGVPFFTMKRVRGRTLAEILEARRADQTGEWSVRRLLGAMSSVALAIDYAHGRGVVHGDLKPQNVMLGRFGEVHVLDWGCASERRDEAASGEVGSEVIDVRALFSLCADDTGRGTVVGTPGYLAPEQAQGRRGEPSSDVYALGAILFEIVVGEPLHRGSTPLSLLVSAMTGVEARPSARAPGLVLPPHLEALIVQALERDPERRPTARALATAIERVLDEEAGMLVARREAERHVRDAREHARRALEAGDDAARTHALRDAGRALALDPENPDATDVLARLLVQPPAELPPEAQHEVAAAEREIVRCNVDAMATRSLVWLAAIPFAVALGVRSIAGSALTIGAIVLCSVVFQLARRRGALPDASRVGMLAVALLAASTMSGMFGPFVLVPLFVTTTCTMVGVALDRRQRRIAVGLGLAAIFVPFALEGLGVLPPSMTIAPDGIVLHPRLVGFPPGLTLALLVVGHALPIPVCIGLAGRSWDAIDQARRRLALRTWQLERALPKRADAW